MRNRLFALAALSFSCITPPAAAGVDDLDIYVIDVGQGDATLIVGPERNGNRSTLLIDVGNSGKGERGVQKVLEGANINGLNHVVLSHYDSDHIGGVKTSNRDPEALFWNRDWSLNNPPCEPTKFFPNVSIIDIGKPVRPKSKWNAALVEWLHCVPRILEKQEDHKAVNWIRIDEEIKNGIGLPQRIEIDLGRGVVAQVVAGRGYVIGNPNLIKRADSPNEMSIAVLVSTPGGFDFLVTGDLTGRKYGNEDAKLEGALANSLARSPFNIDLEVLRAGHHGAANATSPNFVLAMNPEVAFISVGPNPYRPQHPHCETFRGLRTVPIVLQTSGEHPKNCNDVTSEKHRIANGTIRIAVDVNGQGYEVYALPDSSSSGKDTIEFMAKCTIGGGCIQVQ